jgi:hypothetical protein
MGATAVTNDEGLPVRASDTGSGKRGDARYANWFQIGHNAFEFLLEFGQQEARIHTRIYVSPQHARMLSDLLNDSLRKYETAFGPLPRLGG